MQMVQTVTGPINPTSLGTVLSHEHIQLCTLGLRENYPEATVPRDEVVDICADSLTKLKASGVDTIIDHTTFETGRDMELLREVAERSGMNVIAATGIIVTIPRWFTTHSAEDMVPLFVRELTEGHHGTGIRTGIIKAALDKGGLPKATENVLRALARAHVATNVPISTHSWPEGHTGEELQRIFSEEGVDLTKVVIGHSGDTEEMDYLHRLLDRGSYLGMDRFGAEDYLSDDKRISVVVALCREGFADRLMLSQDSNTWSDRDINLPTPPTRRNWNYFHLGKVILPRLREEGVTEDQIRMMTGGNLARMFGATAS